MSRCINFGSCHCCFAYIWFHINRLEEQPLLYLQHYVIYTHQYFMSGTSCFYFKGKHLITSYKTYSPESVYTQRCLLLTPPNVKSLQNCPTPLTDLQDGSELSWVWFTPCPENPQCWNLRIFLKSADATEAHGTQKNNRVETLGERVKL